MKCPRCWTEKAYLYRSQGWKGALLAMLMFRPMKCQHCYHKFSVHWLGTLGKQIRPANIRIGPGSDWDYDLPSPQSAEATHPEQDSGGDRRATPRRRTKAA